MRASQQKAKPQKANNQDKHQVAEQTFLEHIYELRSRLFWIVATIIVVSAAGFQFKDLLISVIMSPLHGQKLVYLTPGGGFSFIFTLCVYFGVLVAIPVLVYHVYRFIQPLLKKSSRTLLVTYMFLSVLLALAGALFGYFVTIPAALDFLATFAGDAVTPNLTAESYLNFVVAYILGLALLFQLPLLLFIFDHVKPFPPGSLLSSQRFVIIGATIVAAIITPTPDAVNMAIVAVPIIGMYQLGVFAVFMRHAAVKRRKAKRQVQAVKQQNEINEEGAQADFFAGIISDFVSKPTPLAPIAQQPKIKKTVVVKTIAQSSMKTTDGIIKQARPRPESVDVPERERQPAARPLPTRTIDGIFYTRSAA